MQNTASLFSKLLESVSTITFRELGKLLLASLVHRVKLVILICCVFVAAHSVLVNSVQYFKVRKRATKRNCTVKQRENLRSDGG